MEKFHLLFFFLSAAFIDLSRQSEGTYRLPNNTRPVAYNLYLKFGNFDQSELSFEGNVRIRIEIIEDTNVITLHSAVDEDSVELSDNNAQPIAVEFHRDFDREFLIVNTTNTPLPAGSFVGLRIGFRGSISTTVRGVYRGSYMNRNSVQRHFLATHMQPTYARSVFPCYDEPKFKATFKISLHHNKQYRSISNMDLSFPVIELPHDEAIYEFKTTPLMSTYLLAFVISDFGYKGKMLNLSTTFRAFSRPDQVENTNFAIDTAMKALHEYQTHFDVTYKGGKLDQVALPLFNAGGMENNFIIFYRETYLLYEQGVTTAYDREWIAATVVHEVCHKFIGNELTYHWWSVLWLAEGFCRFFEYFMADYVYPEMRLEELFAVEALQNVMSRDSSPTIRPMTYYVEKPSEIRSVFDSIAYSKAASVIRMFLYTFTERRFNHALHIYLSKQTSNPEGVAEPVHFYAALQRALPESGINVTEVFESWELQAGYPIVYVERSYNNYRVRLRQNRFLNDVKNGEILDELWYIPITYAFKSRPETSLVWMKKEREMELFISDLKPDKYLIVNPDQTGYYRVMYDDANWMLIFKQLQSGNFASMSPNTRAMLIDDVSVFLEKEIFSMSLYLQMLKYLEHEDDYIPWLSATNDLWYMRRMLDDDQSDLYEDFRKFLRNLLRKVYNKYGAVEKSESEHHEKHIRNIAMNWACQAHLSECIIETSVIFGKIMANQSFSPSVDHRDTVMCNGVIKGGENQYQFLWRLFDNASDSSEKTQLLRTIGCIENYEILHDFIRRYNSDKLQGTQWQTIIQAVYANGPIGMRVTMEFLEDEQEPFYSFIVNGGHASRLNSIFTGISSRVTTRERFESLKKLMKAYKINETTQASINATVEENLRWIDKYSPEIRAFLNSGMKSFVSLLTVIFGLVINIFFSMK